jgi:hypothetical protein
MTAQEVFETVARHLLTQGRQSINAKGHCAYRGAEGRMCAVGCLITDDEYAPVMDEGNDGSVLGLQYKRLLPERLVGHVDLLTDLQRLHDAGASGTWRERLTKLAHAHGLAMPVLP